MTRCANRECPVPAGQRLTQPCLLNTGGMPDVIGSPCASFVEPCKPSLRCVDCGDGPICEPAEPVADAIHGFEMAAICYGKIDECAAIVNGHQCSQPEDAPVHNLALKDELEWNTREDAARAKPAQPPVEDLATAGNAVEMDDDGVVVRDSHGNTNSMRRVTLAQPPVECEHPVARSWDINDGKDFPFRADNVQCDDCVTPMVVRPASQWEAITELVAEWESNVPEGNDKGVLGGMYAGCARQLRKAIGLERVTKGEG
uniref:Uncharacterized protein n=1 Tax=viral metagenome TaxID=1070528 RepID=A0A6M3JF31_9ZZZZ